MAFIFDKEAPDIFRERINEVRSIFPQIKIFCVEGFDDIDATVNHHVDNHTDIVIAPRIDIDDFLKKDVLDVILTEAQKTQSDLCINLKLGFSFDSDSVETFLSSPNAFSSFVEHKKLKPYVTIFGRKH